MCRAFKQITAQRGRRLAIAALRAASCSSLVCCCPHTQLVSARQGTSVTSPLPTLGRLRRRWPLLRNLLDAERRCRGAAGVSWQRCFFGTPLHWLEREKHKQQLAQQASRIETSCAAGVPRPFGSTAASAPASLLANSRVCAGGSARLPQGGSRRCRCVQPPPRELGRDVCGDLQQLAAGGSCRSLKPGAAQQRKRLRCCSESLAMSAAATGVSAAPVLRPLPPRGAPVMGRLLDAPFATDPSRRMPRPHANLVGDSAASGCLVRTGLTWGSCAGQVAGRQLDAADFGEGEVR